MPEFDIVLKFVDFNKKISSKLNIFRGNETNQESENALAMLINQSDD